MISHFISKTRMLSSYWFPSRFTGEDTEVQESKDLGKKLRLEQMFLNSVVCFLPLDHFRRQLKSVWPFSLRVT